MRGGNKPRDQVTIAKSKEEQLKDHTSQKSKGETSNNPGEVTGPTIDRTSERPGQLLNQRQRVNKTPGSEPKHEA